MARSQVVVGREGLQIWRVVANMIKSRMADKGVVLQLGGYEMVHRASDFDSLKRPKQRKMDMRFVTGNVRSLKR
jgi:hypothetical protein